MSYMPEKRDTRKVDIIVSTKASMYRFGPLQLVPSLISDLAKVFYLLLGFWSSM
jgi:hypothetical protein